MKTTSSQKKMTALFVKTAPQGRHYDDKINGLFLLVKSTGAKSWVYRYQLHGKRYDLGLGSTKTITVAVARKKALECKLKVAEGVNPKALKQKPEISYCFEDVANEFIETQKPSWKNQKHISQWYNTLKTYVYPVIGDREVGKIETTDILTILKPIWIEKTETASRIQGRIEAIIDYALAMKMMKGENLARWKNNLSYMLAKPTAIKKVTHHPSMDYRDLPEFVKQLVQKESIASKALLSEYVFESPCKSNTGMTSTALSKVLKMMGREDVTVHGFRSTFRNWIAEQTDTPWEVAETALAHSIGNATAKAYLDSDLLDKRRMLMKEWEGYIFELTELRI